MATPEADATRRGRPLDASRDEPILQATMELLEDRGYDKLTVKDIAERACAGLGAIYRRWPTKLALVVAALQASNRHAEASASTGDTAEDLTRALLLEVSRMNRIPGFVSSMQHEPQLAAAVRDALVSPRQRAIARILAAEFDDDAECELRAEMALGVPLQRLVLGTPLPDEREISDHLVPIILGRRQRRSQAPAGPAPAPPAPAPATVPATAAAPAAASAPVAAPAPPRRRR